MRVMTMVLPAVLLVVGSIPVFSQWTRQIVDTKAGFRGLSVVSEKIVWASGTGGTVVRTVDGGATWKVMTVPGGEKLDFRDIEAFDEKRAYILSIGNGDSSRIYKTADGGATWKQQFINEKKEAFFDAIACWDAKNCLAMSDPVEGHYVLIETKDGETWKEIKTNKMPAARDGEAAFAASGTCLIASGRSTAFLVSGGDAARVFRSDDRGQTWEVANTPMISGTSGSGIFSIAMWDAKNGVIVGGNYEKPAENRANLAFTTDGGLTWTPGKGLGGYRSGVAYIDSKTIVAVGSSGSDISSDGGKTWRNLDQGNYNSVQTKSGKAIWAVGPTGHIASLKLSEPTAQEIRLIRSKHLPFNIDKVKLSHSEISSKCTSDIVDCSASRVITVKTYAALDEELPHDYVYTVAAGRIVGKGSSVSWHLADVPPGKYSITVGINEPISDGRTWMIIGRTDTQFVTVQ